MNKLPKTTTLLASLTLAAATALVADPFHVEAVTFTSGGQALAGNLYLPHGVSAAEPAEAVVITGAWMTIKEQMPGTYAAALAERGLIALAFDFRTWGESGGHTRSLENPEMKIEDIIAAADFLATRPEVSAVNGLGICASAGYMVHAADRSDQLESIALVAPWLHDAAIVEAVYGGADSVHGLIEIGKNAALAEVTTGQPQLVPAAGEVGSTAIMQQAPYYTDPNRGAIAAWENTFNLAFWEGWLTFDAIAPAADLNTPVLIVHSEAAAIPQGAHQFLTAAGDNAEGLWLDGITQFDFYDDPTAVATASREVARFLQ